VAAGTLLFMVGVVIIKPQRTYIIEFFLTRAMGKDIYYVVFWDFFSWLFVSLVICISTMVFFYAVYYIDGDCNRLGFFLLLLSFVVAIILLVVRPNLISLLLGWDGLGVTSYLLVIYYARASSSLAGMLTFLTNRLGDIFFLFSIGLISFFWDWEVSFTTSFFWLSLFLLLAATTKRAQVPFSSWLPAAMAAPTPVSSLVHSSTLVTAGVYLIIRFQVLLIKINYFVFLIGVFTLLVAGLIAVFEWDLKKLIAFSTLRQLGFIVSAYGLGLTWLRFFHLVNHALFKASLFLSAGVLIHNTDRRQEFRNIFLVPPQLFWVARVINICLLCLCGIPFTRGFYSKDLIIDGGVFSFLLFALYLVGVLFTVIYSFRFFFYCFWVSSLRSSFFMGHEKIIYVLFPLIALVRMALLGGWFLFECFFSFWYFIVLSPGWKVFYLVSLCRVVLGASRVGIKLFYPILKRFFFRSLWFLKYFFSSKLFKGVLKERLKVIKAVDQGTLEKIGPQGLSFFLTKAGEWGFYFQSFIVIIFLVVFLLGFLFLWLFSLI
jgi:NADH-ubiquinone oxidoreductase chain 5